MARSSSCQKCQSQLFRSNLPAWINAYPCPTSLIPLHIMPLCRLSISFTCLECFHPYEPSHHINLNSEAIGLDNSPG